MIKQMISNCRLLAILLMSMVLMASCNKDSTVVAEDAYEGLPKTSVEKRDEMIKSGADWLAKQQRDTGNWGQFQGDVGIAALTVRALNKVNPVKYKKEIDKGLELILSRQIKEGKNKGAFQSALVGRFLNYNTAISIMMLNDIDPKKYSKEIKMGQDFITGLQFKVEKDVQNFGAIGYGSQIRGDLSNTQYALQALVETGVPKDSPVYLRVKKFLLRTQNPDGGAAYGVGDVSEGKSEIVRVGDDEYHKSYGSMSYALIKCMIYLDLKKGDKSLDAAFNWVVNNYTLEENPGLKTVADPAKGFEGIYYYFHTFAKSLHLYGVDEIPLKDGRKVDWRAELIDRLADLQKDKSFWYNDIKDRWGEVDSNLCTAYALLTLCETR